MLAGVAIAASAAITGSLTAFAFKWGIDLRNALPEESVEKFDANHVGLFCIVVSNVIGSSIAAPVNLAIGVMAGESLNLASWLISIFLSGLLVHTCANTIWRFANIETDNLGINAMAYGIPVLSLVWLLLLSYVGDVRGDWLIIGAAAIITANIFINFEAEIRWGFKALVLTLWACGAFVYMRDDLLDELPFSGWVWPGETYFGALALSATVFILLLSFRVVRLSGRTQDEDNRIFNLFQQADVLVRRNVIDPSIREHILAVDGSHSPEELQEAYQEAQLVLARGIASSEATSDDLEKLGAIEAQLNVVVHSRRHGIEFGELFALLVFGGITVILALFSRPGLGGWPAFLVEIFAVSFSAVFVFLMVNVWDIQRDRAARILGEQIQSDTYGLIFRDARNRRFEQGISVVIGLGITAIYFCLLWQKWAA